jgi:crossover junction endodeoxyribonuclease RusA
VTEVPEFPHAYAVELPLLRGKPPLSHNMRLHWREKAKRTATIRSTANLVARSLRIPPQRHIVVRLHYFPQDNRRRDAPNLTATSKPAIDGLVDAGVVTDDNDGYVTELMPLIHPTNGGPRRLWLAIQIPETQQ